MLDQFADKLLFLQTLFLRVRQKQESENYEYIASDRCNGAIRRNGRLLATILRAGEIPAPVAASTEESTDLIITGAKIFTSDKQQPWAEALAIKDGKFVYVGDANGIVSYTGTNSIDLNGKLVIPGMVDGHSHPGYVNVENFGEVEGDTQEELLAAIECYSLPITNE